MRPAAAKGTVDLGGAEAEMKTSGRSIYWLLAAGCAVLYGARLGALDFWAPDEPRYGAIAEELRSGRHGPEGLVLLHLGDAPYTQKPPLYFWLAALAGVPTERVTETAARLPSAAAGLGSVLVAAWIFRRLLRDPVLAGLAAALLATSIRFAFTARRAQLDVLLTFFELIAVAVFVHLEFGQNALRPGKPRIPAGSVALLHGALGLGALVKGPVAWLPLAVIAAYLVTQGRGGQIRRLAPAWALTLSLAPVALWMAAAVALAPAGFAEIAVWENLAGRFFSGTSHARPFYYFAFQTPADFLPWTLLLPFAVRPVRAGLEAESAQRLAAPEAPPAPIAFSALWIGVPLLFFSLSAGKRGVYLLPFFPALAVFAVLGGAWLAGARHGPGHGQNTPVPSTPGPAPPRGLVRALVAVALLELILFTAVLPDARLRAAKSPRPIAETVAARCGPEETVGLYGLDAMVGPIGYYGNRRTRILRGEAALAEHLAADPGWVLLRQRDFDALVTRLPVLSDTTFRRGSRRLVLARRSPERAPVESSIPPPARPLDGPILTHSKRLDP